jgi:hypothetical protein
MPSVSLRIVALSCAKIDGSAVEEVPGRYGGASTPSQPSSRAGLQMRARPSMLILIRRTCSPWNSDSVPGRDAWPALSLQLRPAPL